MTGTTSIIAQSYAARGYYAVHHDACHAVEDDDQTSLIQYVTELLTCADPTMHKLPGGHNTWLSAGKLNAATIVTTYSTAEHFRDSFQALTQLCCDGERISWSLYSLPGVGPELIELMIQALDGHENISVQAQTLDDLVTMALATTDPSQLHSVIATHLPCDGPQPTSPDPEILADLLSAMTQDSACNATAAAAAPDTPAASLAPRPRLALIHPPVTPPRSATHAVSQYLPGLGDAVAIDLAAQLNQTHCIDVWADHQPEPEATRAALEYTFASVWQPVGHNATETLARCHCAIANFHSSPHKATTEARTILAYSLQIEACRTNTCT